ncbi:hypothetical protein TD95_001717 [Thielaviopsis punctulata]|uniref:Serine hydrolase domain-containing protein n=1 Tax=Thielaviopsis punctulata TaxID=72032 RepID=A0A0F4ZAP8_9PEZI|nr:hypothetical protein TD95_001717 [Thielaviopsis punctulata]
MSDQIAASAAVESAAASAQTSASSTPAPQVPQAKTGKTPRPPRAPKKPVEKPPMKEYKVLMVHGYTQSGSLFRSKVRALEKALLKTLNPLGITLTFLYPTAPIRLRPRDIPGWQPTEDDADGDAEIESYGWFRFDEIGATYRGIDQGARVLAAEMRAAGGVDVVLGFSQGAFVAAALAAILEQPYRAAGSAEQQAWVDELRAANGEKKLKFAVVYSGFIAKAADLQWLYEPKMVTPSVHIMGGLDTIVEESRTRALIEKCEDPSVFVHPGSHYVPVSREWLNAVASTFKKYLYDDLQPKKED